MQECLSPNIDLKGGELKAILMKLPGMPMDTFIETLNQAFERIMLVEVPKSERGILLVHTA